MPDSSHMRGKTFFRTAAIISLIACIIFISLEIVTGTATGDIVELLGLFIIIPIVVFLIPFAFLPTFFMIGFVTGTPWVSFQWAWTILKRNLLVLVSIGLCISAALFALRVLHVAGLFP